MNFVLFLLSLDKTGLGLSYSLFGGTETAFEKTLKLVYHPSEINGLDLDVNSIVLLEI